MEGQPVNKSGNKQADMPIKKKKKKPLNRPQPLPYQFTVILTPDTS
jgi:hypothetical protein